MDRAAAERDQCGASSGIVRKEGGREGGLLPSKQAKKKSKGRREGRKKEREMVKTLDASRCAWHRKGKRKRAREREISRRLGRASLSHEQQSRSPCLTGTANVRAVLAMASPASPVLQSRRPLCQMTRSSLRMCTTWMETNDSPANHRES